MSSLMKSFIDSVWPRGAPWRAKLGGFYEGLLLGLADSLESVRVSLSVLEFLRNPEKTILLDELELDYGVLKRDTLTEAERRQSLRAKIDSSKGDGSGDDLEPALHAAGFTNLFVHVNDPPIDPGQFSVIYGMTAGNNFAVAGNKKAVASKFTAKVLVNGSEELFGGFSLPTDPATWPLIFFVGGAATRAPASESLIFCGGQEAICGSPDAVCGASETVQGPITDIVIETVPANRKEELDEIILRIKPTHSWCVLAVAVEG